MTGNESIQLLFLFSVVSLACTVYGTFGGKKKDIEKRASEFSEIKIKLDAISNDQRAALLKIERTAADVGEIREKVLRHDFMLEEHEKRITTLEQRADR